MKNLFKSKILDEVSKKLSELENSFIDITWDTIETKKSANKEFIGLLDNKRFYLKKSYTFSPL